MSEKVDLKCGDASRFVSYRSCCGILERGIKIMYYSTAVSAPVRIVSEPVVKII